MDLITEGKAKFYASRDKNGKISKQLEVFYNPVMKFNRDVSVLLLNNCGIKDIQTADIMAGSGVRSLRFLLELKKGVISSVSVNDYDKNFVKLFEKNLTLNKIKKSKRIHVSSMDANMFLLESMGFNYIDVDPFGSPNDFLDASVVRLSRDGILSITATDTSPLSGTHPDACLRNYWAKPLHNHLMHEVGLRILIRKVQLVGAQHDKALIPIYSYFKDHYFRIFFKCTKGKLVVDDVLKSHQYVVHCDKCMNVVVSKFNSVSCPNCKESMRYSGPMWIGKLFDRELAGKMSRSNMFAEDSKFLDLLNSELDTVGFYDIHELCAHYKLKIPNFETLVEKIKLNGFTFSRTHFCAVGIRTNAKVDELVDIIRKI